MPLRFRVSNVDSYLAWRDNEEKSLPDLLQELSGRETDAMRRGTAFHAALERAAEGEVAQVESMGYTFVFTGNFELSLPRIREVRHAKDYGGIEITGKVDCVQPPLIIDHKTTTSFDAERYIRKYQWRYYLDIFNCDRFVWNVFEMKELTPMVFEVYALHQLEQFRYPQMEKDCQDAALDLKRFAEQYMPTFTIPDPDVPKEAAKERDEKFVASLMEVVTGELVP